MARRLAKDYQQVEIFLSANDMPDLDTFSKSDIFLVLYMMEQNNWRRIGRTETIYDNHHPVFQKQFKMNYIFEKEQPIRIEAYDEDKKNVRNIDDHDYVGSVDFVLGEIVHHPGGTVRKVLTKVRGKKKGKKPKNKKSRKFSTVVVKVEEIKQCNQIVNFNIGATKLPSMDFFGGADPFLEFFRMGKGGSSTDSMVKVFSTEVLKDTKNPTWKPFKLEVSKACNGDFHRPIIIRCQDWNKIGKADLIGEVQTSMDELISLNGQSLPLVLSKKPGKSRGTLDIRKSFLEKRYTFLEYLTGGLNMRLMLAIDFTGSNGVPTDNDSLHYINPSTGRSVYMDAIMQVGKIIEVYDNERQFACWGFGAVVGNSGDTDHCFPLTLTDDPMLRGTEGVLSMYKQVVQSGKLQFSGPTLFQYVLESAKSLADLAKPKDHIYNVLLILTDGVVNDMQKTIDSLVSASKLPLSVIIVGIGNANFTKMEFLDADDSPLVSSKEVKMDRDIVQFVPFRDFKGKGPGALAEAVLAELPHQVVEYYQRMKEQPREPRAAKVYDDAEFMARTMTMVDDVAEVKQEEEEPLPEGWEKLLDPVSGKVFYIDHNTQNTSWTRPTASLETV